MTTAPEHASAEELLALIPDGTAVTMADLVRLSGLSRPTVTGMLGRLQAGGAVLCEPAVAAGRRGRPAKRWRRPPPNGLFAAIALSRDAVRVRIAGGDDRMAVEREQRLDVSLDVQGALAAARRLVRECLAEPGVRAEPIEAAVLGLPCPVHAGDRPQARGILPAWVGVRPVEQLRRWLPGARITVENDTNLGAIGELVHGACRGDDDAVYVKLSPGLGAALIVAGTLYRGATGLAGEIGHVQIDDMGHPCVCGTRGCLAMEMYRAALHGTDRGAGLSALAELFRRCDGGDAASGRTLARIGALLGEQLGPLANVLDPARVVISTDGPPPHPRLIAGIREGIRRTALPTVGELPVVASALGARAEVLGGIALARRTVP